MPIQHCCLCSSLATGHASPPELHTRLLFPLRCNGTRRRHSGTTLQRTPTYDTMSGETTRRAGSETGGSGAGSDSGQGCVTQPDELGSGLQRSRAGQRPLCHAGAAPRAAATEATPLRPQPRHQPRGKEGEEGPCCLRGPGTARSPGPAGPSLAQPAGTASGPCPRPRAHPPSASAEETKVKSPLLGA